MRFISIAAILLAACSTHPTSPADDLFVTATVAPTEFRSGEATTVTVSVTNRGDQPRLLHIEGCPYRFVVTTADGTLVGPREQICFAYYRARDLAPGETYVFSHVWSGDGRAGVTDARGLLPPGTYRLRGSIWGDVGPQSNPVTIHIAP